MEKGLKEMTLGELLDSKEFQEELQRQIDNEVEHHDKMMREAYGKGLRLQRNPTRATSRAWGVQCGRYGSSLQVDSV